MRPVPKPKRQEGRGAAQGCTWERVTRSPVTARDDDGLQNLIPKETPSGGPEEVGASTSSAEAEEERGGGATVRAEAGWPHGRPAP